MMNNSPCCKSPLPQTIFDFASDSFQDGIIMSNMFCDFVFLSNTDFLDFVANGDAMSNQIVKRELVQKRFICESKTAFTDEAIETYRKLKGFQFVGTVLHIFVLTLNCNLECVYCQATAGKSNCSKSMTINIADVCVERAFESLSKNIDIEFQGGEPLLNYKTLKHIIERSLALATQKGKTVTFSVVSNLSSLTEEMVEFFARHNVSIAVSIDGPKDLHDLNRPHVQNGHSNFDDVVRGLRLINRHYKSSSGSVNALLTSTKNSFSRVDDIINTYSELNFNSFSIRPLSQFGMANSCWESIGYSPNEFGIYYYEFLKKLLLKCIRDNVKIFEFHAKMFLQKMFNKTPINHMEFRSPCGAAIGQITYDWNGDVYTCDEARMLAASGDKTFFLGNVADSPYNSIVSGQKVRSMAHASIMESLPDCSYCVFQPLCGVCPVYNYAKYGDLYRPTGNDYFCQTRKAIFTSFFKILFNGSAELKNKLIEWGAE